MSKKGMSFMELIGLFRTNPGCFWGVHLMEKDKDMNSYIFNSINKSSNWVIRWNGQRENNQFYNKVECVVYVYNKPFIPKNGYHGKNVLIIVPKEGRLEFDWYCYIKYKGKWVFSDNKEKIANYLRTTKYLAFTSSEEMNEHLNPFFFSQKELKLFKAKFYEDKE